MFSPSHINQITNLSQWRQAIGDTYLIEESGYLQALIDYLALPISAVTQIETQTLALLQHWQAQEAKAKDWPQEFLHAYGLNTREGVVLMCLAEALVRIPDTASARAFIADRLRDSHWQDQLGSDHHWTVNAATWALMWGERLLEPWDTAGPLRSLSRKLSEPIIHRALQQAVLWLADTFVFGADLPKALARAAELQRKASEYRWCYSFDLLGEAAVTPAMAQHFRQNYLDALTQLQGMNQPSHASRFNLSIKLSALHPRYEALQEPQLLAELIGTDTNPGYLIHLAQAARGDHIPLTIDAEESDRLELSLKLIEACLRHPSLYGWSDLGLAVQAYSKRALPVLGYLNQLAAELDIKLRVRLVKGAYWDSEIHWAQRAGLAGYPVYTNKNATDIAYLACAKFLLQAQNLHPQFATHNASTICSLLYLAEGRDLEFQRLQGMGESLYRQLLKEQPQTSCRIYAPVGAYAELLPYLVRRLLENGANNSFVNQLNRAHVDLQALATHPLSHPHHPQAVIPDPGSIYKTSSCPRDNSSGINLAIAREREAILEQLRPYFFSREWHAQPLIAGLHAGNSPVNCFNPSDAREHIGSLVPASAADAAAAITAAQSFQLQWRHSPVATRAQYAETFAELLEQTRAELAALLIREAGKTLVDALDEIREAVDFCRYYAQQARQLLSPQVLTGPTGEHNQLQLEARGIFVCISPWNFPLAIFTGQIIAALVTGNCVLAKPARQTSLVAWRAVQLMHQAGFPPQAIQLVPGNSSELSPVLTGDIRIEGIAFTGSTQSAWAINRALAARDSSIASLIAETGGQNAMIADSTCLPEQLVKDVIRSTFGSAGQRCSALRVLYVQQEIADKVIDLMRGAMACLRLGDTRDLSVDIGPVIDSREAQKLQAYLESHSQAGRLLAQAPAPVESTGSFVAPSLVEINSIADVHEEHFGPICHLVRFDIQQLDKIIADINALGYGLTLGIHSRNQSLAQKIAQQINVGNVYINRNMIGAVVGVQPFGGCGLSGTGPKAGGPHYLLRFVREKTISNFVAAVGGNIQLLAANLETTSHKEGKRS